jgi:hypothetical protein
MLQRAMRDRRKSRLLFLQRVDHAIGPFKALAAQGIVFCARCAALVGGQLGSCAAPGSMAT